MTIKDLLKKTQTYLPKEDQHLIQKAYDFAKETHQDEKRGTGEPYIEHPLYTAMWLAGYELDVTTIAAALLHDVAETNPAKKAELKAIFSSDIVSLVEGVTKLGKIKIKRSWFLPFKMLQDRQAKRYGFERHVESLRKMLLAMCKDTRIVLIKFADRLHNMKTLEGIKPEKRERIAQETIEIYAPLAHRLGMGEIKGTLEDLAFPYAYPKEYKWLKGLVGSKYEEKEKYLFHVMEILKKTLKNQDIKAEVHGRKKHFYSLYKKLLKYDRNFSKIYDLVAIRIIVNTVEECYHVLGIVHSLWKPLIGRIKDYIALPKPNGYRSLHTTIFGPEGEIVEIQIRTKEMHQMAEYGIATHWHYNENKKSCPISKDKFVWLDELKQWQNSLKDSNKLSQAFKVDFFHDRIFAFTPQGDVKDLPTGATPIDFAYAIHTEIGETCIGAKVNGKIVRLDFALSNGDIIEIITRKSSTPKRDWLRFARTSRAQSKIRSYFENKNGFNFNF